MSRKTAVVLFLNLKPLRMSVSSRRTWSLGYIVIDEFWKSDWPDSFYCVPGQRKLGAKNDFQKFWIFRGHIPAFLLAIVKYIEKGISPMENRLLCRHYQWWRYKTSISVFHRVWRIRPSVVLIPWTKRWRHMSGQFAKKWQIFKFSWVFGSSDESKGGYEKEMWLGLW